MKYLTFDVETAKKIPIKGEENDELFEYCEGWGDFEGMGISFVGAKKSDEKRVHVFSKPELITFVEMLHEVDVITGFNILAFDIPLIKEHLTELAINSLPDTRGKVYDMYYDIRKNKVGYPWNLDTVARHTIGMGKSGDGAMAPELWQAGKHAQLKEYLKTDVRIEETLFEHILEHGWVSNGESKIYLTEIKKLKI